MGWVEGTFCAKVHDIAEDLEVGVAISDLALTLDVRKPVRRRGGGVGLGLIEWHRSNRGSGCGQE